MLRFESLALSNVVSASNSLWLTSSGGWHKRPEPGDPDYKRGTRGEDCWFNYFMGHNELMATKTIMELSAADAMVIKLPPTTKVPSDRISLFNLSLGHLEQIRNNIKVLVELERSPLCNDHNVLPIIFYAKSRGMDDLNECRVAWGGTQCDNGYRKEFFSQQFNFSDGSCLASPPGCNDVYFYRHDNTTTSTCTRYTLESFAGCETCRVDLSKRRVNGTTRTATDLYVIYETNGMGVVTLIFLTRHVFTVCRNAKRQRKKQRKYSRQLKDATRLEMI